MSEDYSGPRVYLTGDVATNSRQLGLPVVSDDGFNHAPECWWCKGEANRETCPRSVWLAEYSQRGYEAVQREVPDV